jgi:two-component system, sensor histidine kinase
MINRLRARLRTLRTLVTLSPRITILSCIALAVFVAMIFLGIAVIQQAAASGTILGYNNADVNRPFVQLQRETLRMLTLVRADPAKFDAKAAELQRNLIESRLVVLHYPLVQESLPPESLDASAQIDTMWADVEPLLDSWRANPGDADLQQKLTKGLTDFEFLTNNSEIRYQQLRGEAVEQIGQVSQILLVTLGSLALVLAIFVGIVGVSVYRFVGERRKAEEGTRVAMAAEAAARETNRFKDQFLAVMSHELRTPLNAIIGFLGIVGMSKGLDERNKHMITRARANADRLLTLINDILDLSKIESGRLELIPMTVSIRNLTERWQAQMDVLAKQKGLNFVVKVDDSLPDRLFVDEDAITKITTNLLSNAFKFTEKGEVSLKMRSQDNRWIVEVHDTGIGIPAHMHARIFEAFRQVDSSSQRAYGGTGLGLSIVEQLCKAMNGTIRLDSTVGEGSTFTVSLPLTLAKPEVAPQLVQEVAS